MERRCRCPPAAPPEKNCRKTHKFFERQETLFAVFVAGCTTPTNSFYTPAWIMDL